MYTLLTFKCKKCGSSISEEMSIYDNNMDDSEEIEATDTVTCNKCEIDYHTSLTNKGGIVLANIEGINNNKVNTSTPYYKSTEILPDDLEWYSRYAFKSSYEYFTSTIEDMNAILLSKPIDHSLREIINRMVLVQVISAMESYLSDTLISRVITDSDLLLRLFEVDRELNKEKISISNIIS